MSNVLYSIKSLEIKKQRNKPHCVRLEALLGVAPALVVP